MNTQELEILIASAKRDIDYCESKKLELAENAIKYPVNANYAEKEIHKLNNIIGSHKRRIVVYISEMCKLREDLEATEIETLESEISAERQAIEDVPYTKNKYKNLDRMLTKLDKLKKDKLAKSFEGKKFVNCIRCKGTGRTGFIHIQMGICFGCNGVGKVKTKAYKTFLGEDDLPY